MAADSPHTRPGPRAARRGAGMIEFALVAPIFLLLLVAVAEFGRLGFAYNVVSYAAHHAARYAAVRGSASGHPATAADVQAEAAAYIAGLDNSKVTVTTAWTPDHNPGSTVQVTVSYGFRTILVPLSASFVNFAATCRQTITQ